MGGNSRVPLAEAEAVATSMVRRLEDACRRILVAGSIRRRKAAVGDIEIVAEPRFESRSRRNGDLFEPTRSENRDLLEERVESLLRDGVLATHPTDPKNGERYKKLWIAGAALQLDLFVVRPPADWGCAVAIRTGPAHLAVRLVQGLIARGYHMDGFRVLRGEEHYRCEDESDVFGYAGVPFLAPERRL